MTRALRGDESLNGLSRPELFQIPTEFSGLLTTSQTAGREHIGKVNRMSSGSAMTFTILADGVGLKFIDGDQFIITQEGAGAITVTAGGGVTLQSASSVFVTSAQYAFIAVLKIDDNIWRIVEK